MGVDRSDIEVLNRIKDIERFDVFRLQSLPLIKVLPFELATKFLPILCSQHDWNQHSRVQRSILEKMRRHIARDWRHANLNHHCKMYKTLSRCASWLWLAGNEKIVIDLGKYKDCGKGELIKICNYYDWDFSVLDKPAVREPADIDSKQSGRKIVAHI